MQLNFSIIKLQTNMLFNNIIANWYTFDQYNIKNSISNNRWIKFDILKK